MRLRTTQRERCPYCHDAMGAAERVACTDCGTPHHPACLEELGACTVLGCGGSVVRQRSSVESIRARVRQRAVRYARGLTEVESDEAIRRRLNHQPPFCAECLKEIRVFGCPQCGGPLAQTCDGSARHCGQEDCRPFYDRLCAKIGAPIDHEPVPDWRKPADPTLRNLLVGGLVILSFVGMVIYSIALMLLGYPL